jgi:2-oxoglutarate ferredoxin oxidoreductase subunit beta
MKPVFTITEGMHPVSTSYCPGCTHGISHRIIMECLDEAGKLGETIGVAPIGCSIASHQFMNVDMLETAHGRAPAVATEIRSAQPDKVIFTYQGDDDLASIRMSEIIHAANRGEAFTTFFINNAIYGMTGGQMAPTTLVGQKSTTSAGGRDPMLTGMPMRMCELISTLDRAVYVERVALDTPAHVRQAKKAVKLAFEVQEKRLGFSFVEFLSTCPTNWGLSPVDSLKFVDEKMIPYYPLGVYRSPKQEEAAI